MWQAPLAEKDSRPPRVNPPLSAYFRRFGFRSGIWASTDSRQIVMCSRAGCLPVMIDARVGEQTGAAA